jgi:DNA-binding response OmpR family regulator
MARILIINDERDLLKLCQEALREAGHDAEIAAGGSEGVERARRDRPDLVVLDWVIDDMDGNAVMARLRGFPETQDVPVLAMSALRDGPARAELAGAEHFLPKPFEPDDLVEAVNQLLSRSGAAGPGGVAPASHR